MMVDKPIEMLEVFESCLVRKDRSSRKAYAESTRRMMETLRRERAKRKKFMMVCDGNGDIIVSRIKW